MDFVARTPDCEIPVILEPTKEAFVPVLEKQRSKIEGIERKTFKYGATVRNQLDVFYPPTGAVDVGASKPPILFFIYGGGFYSGDRVFSPPFDLGYRNVGAFFARRGFLTVIPDYTLCPPATYPLPSEEVRDALAYVVGNFGNISDTSKIVIHAHSAGSMIVATMLLLEPCLLEQGAGEGLGLAKRLKGVHLTGCPFHFRGPPSAPPPVVDAFFGPEVDDRLPYTLFEKASQSTIDALPPLFIARSEKEPAGIALAVEDFEKLLGQEEQKKRLGGKTVEFRTLSGHNHISPHWALGSGEGEEWGEEAAEWFHQRVA